MDGTWETRYPLTGIRAATTAPQEALIERATAVLREDPDVLALWLSGSLASGRGDPYSDVDLHCCVPDESVPTLEGDGWKDLLHRITPTVMATTFPHGSVGGYALTPDWTHLDLVVHGSGSLPLDGSYPVRPLFDRTGQVRAHEGPPITPGPPYFPAETVDLYFYLFGNMATVVARNEPLLLNNGVVAERDVCLTSLLYAERGIRKTGGAKRVRPFLSDEQYRLLQQLPAIDGTLDACIDACLAVARIFIPRGRALAARVGARWPADLERATVAHVEKALGVEVRIEAG